MATSPMATGLKSLGLILGYSLLTPNIQPTKKSRSLYFVTCSKHASSYHLHCHGLAQAIIQLQSAHPSSTHKPAQSSINIRLTQNWAMTLQHAENESDVLTKASEVLQDPASAWVPLSLSFASSSLSLFQSLNSHAPQTYRTQYISGWEND